MSTNTVTPCIVTANTRRCSFEKEDAAEWQPKASKHLHSNPHATRQPSSPRAYTRKYHNAVPPGLTSATLPSVPRPVAAPKRLSHFSQAHLIDLEEPEERPVQSRYGSANPFAALNTDSPAPSSASTPHRDSPMSQPHNRAGTNGQRRTSSNLDLLCELSANALSTPFNTSRVNASENDGRQSSYSLLDEDVPMSCRGGTVTTLAIEGDAPMLDRDEGDVWFEAQSLGQKPSPSAQNVGNLSCPPQMLQCHMSGQSINTSQANYRVSSSGRSSPRGGTNTRGRGSLRGREGHTGAHFRGSNYQEASALREDNPCTRVPHTQISQHSHIRESHSQFSPRPAHEGAPKARANGKMRQPSDAESAKTDSSVLLYGRSKNNSSTETGAMIAGLNSLAGRDQALADKISRAIESEKPIPSLAGQHDTAGMLAWRTNRSIMPDIVVALPKDLNFAAALSESRSSSKPVLPRVQEIAIATGTYINPIWGNYKGSKTVKLLFYGTPEATESARKLVSDWIQELKDQSDEKWAKVWAYNTHDEKRLRKRLIKNTERQRYCKALTENDQVPTYSLTFPWPLKREPEKVLGPNYEALDPIRMDCQSWVAREKHPGPAIFKIQGHEEGRVQDALKRMQNIPRSFDAKIFEVEPFTIIDVPPSDSKKFPPVIRTPYHPPRPLKDPSDKMEGGLTFQFKYPLTDTWALQDVTEPDDFPDDSLEDPLALQLLNKVIETTQHARYFNGLLRMNIHLGTFVAQKAWDVDIGNNAYKYFTFADMIKGSEKMEARVSAEIGDPIMESHVLARCFEGKKILAPQDPWTRRLSAVKPIYAATFEIATPLGQGDLILDVELSCEGGTTNVLSKRWYRLRENKSEPRKLLDGSILNLENGLAWQIRLDQYVPVDELNLSRDYYIFPDTLTLDIDAAEDLENHNFVVYRSRHDRVLQVPIQSVRQKRLWRFNTKAGEWVVEVGKVDKTVFIHGQPQRVFEPRWTLNLSHNKWDELLALNKRIEVGQSAAWGRGNPANLLFPRNQDMSFITGLARQDMEESDDESEQENDDQENSAGDKEDRDTPEEQASVQSFQDLLDLLRQLADLVSSKA